MKVSEAVASRITTRAFLPRPVDPGLVRELLAKAARAPSGGNLQPWRIYGVHGASCEAFLAEVEKTRAQHPFGEKAEYNVYPPKLKEPYRTRRYRVGEQLYAILGIPREDRKARLAQLARNYDFFGARTALFFTIDRDMQQGQWSDLGMFLQTIMLLAREAGLHSCPQEAWASFSPTIRRFFAIPPEEMVFCGMGIGYIDEAQPVNGLRTERAPVEEFAVLKGF